MIGFVTWPPFCTIIINKGGQVTKPIIVVKICYKLLYAIQVAKKIFVTNLLASTDQIKVFGRTYLFAMLLLIRTLFYLLSDCGNGKATAKSKDKLPVTLSLIYSCHQYIKI